jgi:hypothetical protein
MIRAWWAQWWAHRSDRTRGSAHTKPLGPERMVQAHWEAGGLVAGPQRSRLQWRSTWSMSSATFSSLVLRRAFMSAGGNVLDERKSP